MNTIMQTLLISVKFQVCQFKFVSVECYTSLLSTKLRTIHFFGYLFYVVIKIIFILFVMIDDCHICRKPYKVDRPRPSQEDFHSRDCHP